MRQAQALTANYNPGSHNVFSRKWSKADAVCSCTIVPSSTLLPLLSPPHGYILLTTGELQRYDLFFLSNNLRQTRLVRDGSVACCLGVCFGFVALFLSVPDLPFDLVVQQ